MYEEESVKFEAEKLKELIVELTDSSKRSEATWTKIPTLSNKIIDSLNNTMRTDEEFNFLVKRFTNLGNSARRAALECEMQYLEHVGVEQTEQDPDYIKVFGRPDYRKHGIDFTALKKQLLNEAIAIKEARDRIATVITVIAKVKMLLVE